MRTLIVVLAVAHLALCDVSHILHHHEEEITTPPPPPQPYAFGYAAGRFPGHIDRTHTEISDGEVVKGSFSYVDPHFKIRTVDYTADKAGFHPILNHPQRALPRDSEAVAAAKERHLHLYASIANAHHAGGLNRALPRDSASVAHAKAKHESLYQQIAAEHARIAAERALEAANAPIDVEQELQVPHY